MLFEHGETLAIKDQKEFVFNGFSAAGPSEIVKDG